MNVYPKIGSLVSYNGVRGYIVARDLKGKNAIVTRPKGTGREIEPENEYDDDEDYSKPFYADFEGAKNLRRGFDYWALYEEFLPNVHLIRDSETYSSLEVLAR